MEEALQEFLNKSTEETDGELLFTLQDLINAFQQGYKAGENNNA